MTVTTVHATAPGGVASIWSYSATYALARTGAGTFLAASEHVVGQGISDVYYVFETFLIFDTSGIPDTDVVSDVVLSLDGLANSAGTNFTAVAASSIYDGGAAVSTDFISGAALGALTTYATWASSTWLDAYNDFTSAGAAFNSAINKTGNTAIMLYSERVRDAVTPTGNEYVEFTDADAAGTTTDPKLVITHAAGAATGPSWWGRSGWW